ncbi:hypothetical protein NOR51B_2251 [Luminiphilus syltensis NOR5-1B]|uniref:Uncharacterized protein n=1 Tax=Luminiphilus syltensis NOR5-1B TaxID=565045 RepID=B8KVI9_9GAMM|nr:hypothetical protein NOR51B_2251 [Luminiphilus syltensis NOR5-1B]
MALLFAIYFDLNVVSICRHGPKVGSGGVFATFIPVAII